MLESSVGFREISLYGKRIFITEDLSNAPTIPSDIAVVRSEGLYSRKIKASNSTVSVGKIRIGGRDLIIAAGPCAVESSEQMIEVAEQGKKVWSGYAFVAA
ncbi:phospho-2-dehydro-3-deoxyheptonate aldolase, partial [mine drainage metagenome]